MWATVAGAARKESLEEAEIKAHMALKDVLNVGSQIKLAFPQAGPTGVVIRGSDIKGKRISLDHESLYPRDLLVTAPMTSPSSATLFREALGSSRYCYLPRHYNPFNLSGVFW
jgi:hypothetical protein